MSLNGVKLVHKDINNGKKGKYKDIEIFNPIKINEIADQVKLIVIMTPNKTAFGNICKLDKLKKEKVYSTVLQLPSSKCEEVA